MEFLKNLSPPSYERLKSPLYSSLLFSWFICNWKIWISLIFYEETINGIDKIQYINCLTHNYCRMYILPVIITAFYLKAMPYIENEVFKNNEKNKAKKRQARLDQLKVSTVSGAEYLELFTEKESFKNKYGVATSQVQYFETEINTLKKTIKDQTENLKKANDDLNIQYNLRNNRKNLRGKVITDDWKRTFSNDLSKNPQTEIFFLDSSNNYMLRISQTEEKPIFKIECVDIDFDSKIIEFLKIELDVNRKRIYKVYLRNVSENDRPKYIGTETNIFDSKDSFEVCYEPKI